MFTNATVAPRGQVTARNNPGGGGGGGFPDHPVGPIPPGPVSPRYLI